MARSCNVAVIGAGVSGLAAARELLREGHRVAVFERSARVGGLWADHPASHDHGVLYPSLRTNLPRPLMGFSDYPLAGRSFGDGRSFPGHAEVRAFLEAFAADAGVAGAVRLRTGVVRVAPGGPSGGWAVKWRRSSEGSEEEEVVAEEEFEAVVVCTGHHMEPRLPEIPGIDSWPGKQIHSSKYRIPEPFRDQMVVIIGTGASAMDISIEISHVAKEVHIASRSPDVKIGRFDEHNNIWQHSMVSYVRDDGRLFFNDGSSLLADVILYCTGYKYHFPFLEFDEITIDDNRIGPLYKHIFPPKHAPWLSFVGLPEKAIIFLTIELQCKLVACTLSGKAMLPSEEDMMASVNKDYCRMEEIGRPKHQTHALKEDQAKYLNWLAAEVRMSPIEEWRFQMYDKAYHFIFTNSGSYREQWDAGLGNEIES